MACVTIRFQTTGGEKRRDQFIHFDGCTEKAIICYWKGNRKDRQKVEILEITICESENKNE